VSLYKRDEIFPEWEPIPWGMSGEAADEQESGFHERALKPIAWRETPWRAFPPEGIFGHGRDWFISNEVAFFASVDGEDLILIRNTWHGWPDPPEWGLASRRRGRTDIPWTMWGSFPTLPAAWSIPGEAR